jgi:hypothetical protein
MKLTNDQHQALTRALIDYFTTDTLERFLSDKLGKRLERISTGPNLDAHVYRVVESAQKENWVLELVRAASQERPHVDELKKLYAELEPLAPAAGVDHYEACLLQGNQALIDRLELRAKVKELANATSARVLLVNGPPSSGKTHSAQFINHLEKVVATFQVVRIDLRRQVPAALGVEEVAKDILSQMGLDVARMPPKGNEQDARWAQLLWNWVTGELRKGPQHVWYFIIDGLNQVALPQGTRDLIEELALRIQQQWTMHSLILIGYEEQEKLESLGVSTEREDIRRIEPKDVVAFFIKVFEERKHAKNLDYTHDDVVKAAAKVLEATSMSDPRWLRLLGTAAARVAREVMRTGGQT